MRHSIRPLSVTAIPLLIVLACGCGSKEPQGTKSASNNLRNMVRLSSSKFENGAKLNAKYTVEGQNTSPPLTWTGAPSGTKSFALICDDPDAPSPQRPAAEPWVHWVIFNIPADRSALSPRIGKELQPEEVPGAKQGVNSWPSDNVGYRGPAPPPGSGKHRYFFRLYAVGYYFAA